MIATFHRRLDEIDAAAWDALRPDDNPFLAHAFLAGLERCGCIVPRFGWQPHHLAVHDGDRLVAAAPLYLKGNSHGEFVFDWAWADAYERHGVDYYPKLLAAVPYSPVTGPRLLAPDGAGRALAAQTIRAECERLRLSSAHANFVGAGQTDAFAGWLPRYDWQFHWRNRGWRDFGEFLDALTAKKRKNVRQERALVARSGIELARVRGDAMDDDDIDFVYACYRATFDEKGNHPALTRAFFGHLTAAMPRNVMAVVARHRGERVAAALFLQSSTTLYGRYWGARVDVPGLHFEACYYQGIEYCIEQGLERFEPGAQGEHKLARGFLPQRTESFHYIADSRFRDAIAQALAVEAHHREADGEELLRHSPYRDVEASA
ncbi:MAG TPA: GNAT family N-acetyltransferase [Tahibacter sp.]|nr:GNAT family N-acetyltransferase [Tahibacter sp.]